jgi:hypothetical protein
VGATLPLRGIIGAIVGELGQIEGSLGQTVALLGWSGANWYNFVEVAAKKLFLVSC